jgi:hypothetical protein
VGYADPHEDPSVLELAISTNADQAPVNEAPRSSLLVVLPWVLFSLFAVQAAVLAKWGEPVSHWVFTAYLPWLTLFASPILIAWILYSLSVIWRFPERRRWQAQCLGYVLAFIAATSTAWLIPQFARAAYAETVIQAVRSYRDRHGQYPADLEQLGIKVHYANGQDTGTERWGISYLGRGSPVIAYPGPIPFSMNVYEFDSGHWTYSED